MRLLSPFYLHYLETSSIKLGLRYGKPCIPILVPSFGLVKFIPIQASALTKTSFKSNPLGSCAPMLDIPMLEGLTFKYVYDDIGDLDVSKLVSPFIQYSTDYETQGKTFIVDRIRAPCLEENDILLTPERAK